MVVRHDFAAGGVLLDGERRVVLIEPAYRRGEWALPKGHPEARERVVEAALREVREETGFIARIVWPRRHHDTRYTYVCARTGDTIHKRVRYFLMRVVRASAEGHDNEVTALLHLSPRAALNRLTHSNERAAVRRLALQPPVGAFAAITLGAAVALMLLSARRR